MTDPSANDGLPADPSGDAYRQALAVVASLAEEDDGGSLGAFSLGQWAAVGFSRRLQAIAHSHWPSFLRLVYHVGQQLLTALPPPRAADVRAAGRVARQAVPSQSRAAKSVPVIANAQGL